MDSFQKFLELLPQMPPEERVINFRAEALRPLSMAVGIAKLLQIEMENVTELPDDIENWSQKLLYHLDEMQQLIDALVQPSSDGILE